ncbi:hypothetical protein [Actinomadura sp. WMMB 499]|uniref:hypothetical protein n=1 Tax=Actinomadura sp. WMMB 499 TaxID=1219491 RepID=UPI0012484FA6|nr:hypothetical protein [Actinomadura sp. WMMB 499]QFG23068.1 hypothetical protein F7P10_20025 [Actinomadura sp. WMMB 499]
MTRVTPDGVERRSAAGRPATRDATRPCSARPAVAGRVRAPERYRCDSKAPAGPVVVLRDAAFRRLVADIRDGVHDLPPL